MKNHYPIMFAGLQLLTVMLYAEQKRNQSLSPEQRARYVLLLKKLNEKVARDFKQNLRNQLSADSDDNNKKQERYLRSVTLKDESDRYTTSTYSVRVRAHTKLLFSDGRCKPAIETFLSGIVQKKRASGDSQHASLRHHQMLAQEPVLVPHDEVADMIQQLIAVGEVAQSGTRSVIKLDDCTECELHKPQKGLDYRTIVCRRTMPEDFFSNVPHLQRCDSVIFEPGIKNYSQKNPSSFDYKERLNQLLQEYAIDLDGLLKQLVLMGQENHAWNFYFMEKNIIGKIIKQISAHYGTYAPEYIAARFDMPAGIVWAQERIAGNARAARKLAKIFLHKTSDPAADTKVLKNIIAIVHQVCDKDLVSQGLMRAITAKNLPLINMLLHHGADVNFISPCSAHYCTTPLEHAVSLRESEIAQLLVYNGAKITAQEGAATLARELVLAVVETSNQVQQSPAQINKIQEKNLYLIELLIRAGLRDTTGDLSKTFELCKTKYMSKEAQASYDRIGAVFKK